MRVTRKGGRIMSYLRPAIIALLALIAVGVPGSAPTNVVPTSLSLRHAVRGVRGGELSHV